MRKSLLTFVLIWVCQFLSAQKLYDEFITDSVEVSTYTYAVKQNEILMLDAYVPFDAYNEDKAVIIYIHGGGFSNGTKNIGEQFCRYFARYGFVTFSISYRLTRKNKPEGMGCDCLVSDKLYAYNAAVEDLLDASNFIIQNRKEFGIDSRKIILCGSSAGAITVLNAVYRVKNDPNNNSNPILFAGVISMAGAIQDTSVINKNNAIPTLLFHGTSDNKVPYATAPHRNCKKEDKGYIILHGSNSIAKKLNEFNVPFWLHTTCGGDHEMAVVPMNKYLKEIKEFCNKYIILREGEKKHTIIFGDKDNCDNKQFFF